MKRGRKSLEEHATVVSLVPGIRPDPPKELSPEQSQEWRAITTRMTAGWFTPEVWPLLAQLCRHISISRLIGTVLAEINPSSLNDEKTFRRFEKLRRMHQAEGRAIATLATKLRITLHARYDQRAAHLAAHSVPPGPRPWETS